MGTCPSSPSVSPVVVKTYKVRNEFNTHRSQQISPRWMLYTKYHGSFSCVNHHRGKLAFDWLAANSACKEPKKWSRCVDPRQRSPTIFHPLSCLFLRKDFLNLNQTISTGRSLHARANVDIEDSSTLLRVLRRLQAYPRWSHGILLRG